MQLQGAVVKEQGITFAIVVVKSEVLNNSPEANKMIGNFQRQLFSGMPVILMSQDSRGVPTYFGRPDIARFLSNVPIAAIPWREYSVN